MKHSDSENEWSLIESFPGNTQRAKSERYLGKKSLMVSMPKPKSIRGQNNNKSYLILLEIFVCVSNAALQPVPNCTAQRNFCADESASYREC